MPWVIVAAILAVMALVAVGVGIGYSAWGSSSSSAAPSTRPATKVPGLPEHPRTGTGTRTFTATGLPGRAAAKTAFLGVEIAAGGYVTGSSTSSPGAHVVRVVAGSPAAHAGIKAGDTITRFDGRRVASGLTLRFDVQHDSPGQQVQVTWKTSSGTTHSATVKLAHRPANQSIG